MVKRVHIQEPRANSSFSPLIWNNDALDLTGRKLEEDFDIRNKQALGPIALSVFVEFMEGGEIAFTGQEVGSANTLFKRIAHSSEIH